MANPCIKEALLYEQLESEKVRCGTCERFCKIASGKLGFCKTRMNIDGKGCGEAVRKYCGADVELVWRNIKEAKRKGVHIEITTLIIPGVNDDEECVRSIASRIRKDTGENTPWHVTQYYPAYKSQEFGLYNGRTPVEILERAREIGKEEGLNYVYIGNVPGHPYENTYCPRCGALLIKRYSFDVVSYHITAENKCPECGQCIPI